jgi:hypothetical protein
VYEYLFPLKKLSTMKYGIDYRVSITRLIMEADSTIALNVVFIGNLFQQIE